MSFGNAGLDFYFRLHRWTKGVANFASFFHPSRDSIRRYRIKDHDPLHHPLVTKVLESIVAPSFRQTFFRRLPLKRLPPPNRRSSLSKFHSKDGSSRR